MQLSITSPLTVHIQPTRQTVDLGKSAELVCNVNGFPRTYLYINTQVELKVAGKINFLIILP